ncbi:RCC1/BLIP-II [Dentipellis sp. KUC8613]|nr:RCC1/BLIP-II [Dentipellis sp. KUC8613]
MPTLTDLPVEVLLDNLIPLIPIRDVSRLARTNKFFAILCADDMLWKKKCQEDFNFTGSETARTSGFMRLYRGLSRPRIFVWGENRNGRLGNPVLAHHEYQRAVFQPSELTIPGVRIVSLVAGGMSFHALDSEGNMYVWGTLDGEGQMALNSEGFSIPYKSALTPHKLLLPEPIRSISCGRLHTMALDSKSQVWTFLSWGRPFLLRSPLLDCHAPDTTPLQVECGWAFSSVLTKSGDVLVYWPFGGTITALVRAKMAEMNAEGDKNAYGREGIIACAPWALEVDPVRLPAIPSLLPTLPDSGLNAERLAEETRLVKIASFDNYIVGLTNKGHVLKYGPLSDETSFTQSGVRWEYLPNFSEAARVAEDPAFSAEGSQLEAPKTMLINHISAHFETFVAYSTGASSIILMGDTSSTPSSAPKINPHLQARNIISIVLGDYHFAALTAAGQLLTWGAYSQGALGLGDPLALPVGAPGAYASARERADAQRRRWGPIAPPDVQVPAEVAFGHAPPGRMFCFAAAASGWHTGALVIDLEVRRFPLIS